MKNFKKYLTCLIDVTELNVIYGKVSSITIKKTCKNGKIMKQWNIEVELKGMVKTISCKAFDLMPRFRKGSKLYFKGTWDEYNDYDYFIVTDANLTGIFDDTDSDEEGWEDGYDPNVLDCVIEDTY